MKNNFILTRVLDIKKLPKQVFSSVIRIPKFKGKLDQKKIADSVLNLAKKGADFKSLAKEFSSEFSEKNFLLGPFTYSELNKEIEIRDFVFHDKPKSIKLLSDFDEYKIIKIESQANFEEAFLLANLTRQIMPSDKTIDSIYNKAIDFEFLVKNSSTQNLFRQEAESLNLNINITHDLKIEDSYISGIGEFREIVKWAFNNKLGSVKKFENEDGIVICFISSKQNNAFHRYSNLIKENLLRPHYFNNISNYINTNESIVFNKKNKTNIFDLGNLTEPFVLGYISSNNFKDNSNIPGEIGIFKILKKYNSKNNNAKFFKSPLFINKQNSITIFNSLLKSLQFRYSKESNLVNFY